ncbi:hypothetical protein MLD38_003154 [Melastoma candidum]|uniref:Uncharacterized protein n=1 Tax=Melastoma candidum TaxID=119954 RepID=A0ACB9S1C2_9MYRT|nr:hypothetical protein MLD38_003154 [Melastoma candidum]
MFTAKTSVLDDPCNRDLENPVRLNEAEHADVPLPKAILLGKHWPPLRHPVPVVGRADIQDLDQPAFLSDLERCVESYPPCLGLLWFHVLLNKAGRDILHHKVNKLVGFRRRRPIMENIADEGYKLTRRVRPLG